MAGMPIRRARREGMRRNGAMPSRMVIGVRYPMKNSLVAPAKKLYSAMHLARFGKMDEAQSLVDKAKSVKGLISGDLLPNLLDSVERQIGGAAPYAPYTIPYTLYKKLPSEVRKADENPPEFGWQGFINLLYNYMLDRDAASYVENVMNWRWGASQREDIEKVYDLLEQATGFPMRAEAEAIRAASRARGRRR